VLSRQTILIVDDDELLAGMLTELLREEGYQVSTARNGLHGYSIYPKHQAETVLADIEMPGLDGFEMMRCIRGINPSVRTIYMSGASGQHRRTLVTEVQKFGATVLRKPFDALDLLKLLSPIACEKAAPGSATYEGSRDPGKPIWKHAV
jgi:CheY-like chemotaxis protein